MTAAFFFGLGALAGVAQAALLAQAAARGSSALSLIARLSLVIAVLLPAALCGHLLASVAGWMPGFAGATAFAYRRLG